MNFLRARWYLLRLWLFRWVQDHDGDIGLQFFRCITFIKYKESTLIYWFRRYNCADKWQGNKTPQTDPPYSSVTEAKMNGWLLIYSVLPTHYNYYSRSGKQVREDELLAS